MAKINLEILKKCAKLSKLACEDEELQKLVQHLSMIVSHADSMTAVETDNVPPCNHVLEGFESELRADECKTTLNRKAFIDNSPDRVGDYIRVPTVLKF